MTDYDALVKMLRTCSERDSCIDWDAGCPYLGTGLCDDKAGKAADAIEDLLAALTASNEVIAKNKPRWIPVTERMPEKNGKYLCNIKRFGQYAGMQYYYVDVLVFQEDCFFEDGIGTERVTHWMPLPTPPKEET